MKQVLLSGYYGFNNIGDEAVLGGILAGLRTELPNVRPVVLSADPEGTRQLHGVDAIPRMDRAVIQAELRHTDLFISGGGSLLQDVTSFRSPLYYLGVLWLAQRAGVPTMMLAQGVGPLRNPINRFLAKKVLNRLHTITVRDAASAAYLRALGVETPPVEVTADPSFLLAPNDSAPLAQWWESHLPAKRPVIGVAIRHWPGPRSEERYTAIADALAALAEHSGAQLLFLPMQYTTDLPIAEEMAGWTPADSRVLDIPLTAPEMLAAIGRCDFIVAMRLHALIFAVQRHVPAFGISYDPKVLDFSLASRLPVPLDWDEVTPEGLTTALRQHWDAREALRAVVTSSAVKLATLAQWNIARVKELLGA
ncbi:MAG TPA: polysaccharide pyruvyl transferase CsaB [Armatimonadota bacterium]|jgi:polysaccharide pyruvyl transferase CsaB